jgi:hypothetical protein
LALHLTLLLSLLLIPPTQPPSEPLTMDVVVAAGPAEGTSEPPALTEATAAPTAPVQQAETPAPVPEVPPPPPVVQAETPAPAPEVPPPPPVQQAETPAPAPVVLPPPPPPVAQLRPPRATPQRAAARAPANPLGAPARSGSPSIDAAADPVFRGAGTPWVKFWERGHQSLAPVTEVGKMLTWTGREQQFRDEVWWQQYAVWPDGDNRLSGAIGGRGLPRYGVPINRNLAGNYLDLTCATETLPSVTWNDWIAEQNRSTVVSPVDLSPVDPP